MCRCAVQKQRVCQCPWDDVTEREYQIFKRTGNIADPWTIVRSGEEAERIRKGPLKR